MVLLLEFILQYTQGTAYKQAGNGPEGDSCAFSPILFSVFLKRISTLRDTALGSYKVHTASMHQSRWGQPLQFLVSSQSELVSCSSVCYPIRADCSPGMRPRTGTWQTWRTWLGPSALALFSGSTEPSTEIESLGLFSTEQREVNLLKAEQSAEGSSRVPPASVIS